jgi:hypothetical protein|tara:strand:- start:973 stop:1164 length:192 start_codon:yes stop_codon:yes gene_type:complete
MKKLLTYVIVSAFVVLTLGTAGCAEQIMAIPGTLVEGTVNVVSSVWHLATDWIPGVGNPAPVE